MAKNKHSENMTKLKLIWKVYGGHPIRLAKRLFLGEIPFDAYVQVSKSGKNIEEDKKSIAFSLTFEDYTKTLTDEEVTMLFEKVIHEVTEKYHAVLRDHD